MALEVNRGRASKAKGERMAKECISPKTAKGDPYVCVFCLNGADEELCGKMFTKGKIAVHYFCMLFASGLSQNGESENQGILGFLQPDIEKEVKRGYRLKCSYCRQPGATIGCVVRNCKKMFHLGCGRREGSMHQFFGTFCSYCPAHRIEQDVPSTDDPNIVCSICMNIVTASPSDDTLRAPCCSKYWYHRDCVQAYSMSAGLHFFKCPLCNNKDEFQQEMLTMGIYIPDQDASWEKEPNAFQELLERYGNCDAPKCKSEKGRTYNKEDTKWEIILCDFCGSHGSHKACNHLIKHGKRKMCQDCKEVDDKTKYEMDEMYTGCHLSPSPSKRNSLEALQLQLNSPNSSKASSLYPGPSSAMKKKGLPQAGNMEGKCRKYQRKRAMEENASPSSSKKAKKRKTATCLYNDMSFSDQDDEPLATLRQPIPASENKVRHYTKKSDIKDLPVSGPRSILRDWLTTQNSRSSSKVKKQSTGVQVSPRKKKPFLMEYEGKELLIKSPRVVLKRKLIYPRDGNSLQPRNLVIDMSDGKLCSDWNKEMEVLTNIDTDKRVTRNMIDLDAAKTVFDQAKESNGKLYLNNVSPKKQYLPLFPNLEPSGSMAFDTQSKTTETKQPMDGQSQVKISSSSKQGRKRRSELTKIRRKTEQLEKRRATIGGKDSTIGESLFDRKEELHADTEYEVTDTKGKIKLKRKTLPYVKTNHKIDGTSSTVKNEPSTTETVNSSPGNSPYVKPGSSGVTKPDTAVKIKKENISSLKEDSPIFSQKKNHVSSLNKDSPIFPKAKKQISVTSPLRGNTVKKNKKKSLKKSLLCDSPSFQSKKIKGSSSKKLKQRSLDGFISRSSVSPEVPTTSGESKAKTGYTSSAKISKDIPSTEIVNCPEKSKSLPMTPINKRSTAVKKGSLLESELNDSPAKNLRCRNLAFTETECLDYTEGNTENTDESNNVQTHPTSIDADTNTLSRETLGKSTSTNSNTKLIDNKSNTRSNVTEVNTRCRVADNSELSTDTDNFICDINSNTKTANRHNHSKSIDINTKSPDVSSFIDRLKKKCLGLDQYNPFKANCESDSCTADDETDSADEDELTTTTKNGLQSGEKPQCESEVCWHLDGTRQISVGPIISTSEQKRRPKSLQLNSQSNLLSTPPRFSPRKKTESSDSPVVNTLSDLQNVIPSFDNDSEEDLCDTANSLSPSYFTKFRNALSRSGSFDSTITNSLVNVKDIPLPNTEPSATAVTYSNFVASRYNILEPKPYNIFVKRRSSPRKFNDKTPNKKLDYTSSRQSQRKTVEKFDEITNDQSIMSEYYK